MLKVNELDKLYLGCQGENLAQTILIDVNDWLVDFPSGIVSIWHKRNGDEAATPTGATLDREKGIISWSPTSTDTYVSGEGEAEIRLTESNVIKKSRKIVTGVSPAVTGAGSPLGSGWQDYINEVESYKSAALQAKIAAETARDTAAQWATGGTSGTPGETNNAKYYSEIAEEAQDAAERAAEVALTQGGYIKFAVNQQGHLIFSYTEGVPVAPDQ